MIRRCNAYDDTLRMPCLCAFMSPTDACADLGRHRAVAHRSADAVRSGIEGLGGQSTPPGALMVVASWETFLVNRSITLTADCYHWVTVINQVGVLSVTSGVARAHVEGGGDHMSHLVASPGQPCRNSLGGIETPPTL